MQRKIKGLLTLMLLLLAVSASADEIRYVSKSGKYSNDGKSWSAAKKNIQDAINDLVDNGLSGEVWVAAGTYTPTESTESTGGNTLYMSFKIPAGIRVYGGFKGTETSKDERETDTSKPIGQIYKNQTILSGDLSSTAEFTWNSTKEQWDASFYGNCYHVVFFATKGFDANGRALPNGGGYKSALLEGCIIEHGNATNTDLAGRPHNAYGGGVYMVEGAYLSNCVVRQCVAYRNGGGIYMDGGGYVEHTAVTDCQTVGIGTSFGYGGGVCMDGPDTYGSSSNPMILRRSGVFGCVGRMGGGVALVVSDTIGNNKYKVACTGVAVTNNTAITEGGGVYMNRGGAMTQMTIVNNKCNGSGIISNGMATGRSAGVYCRDNAILTNSVLWGGKCSANNDIQYATSRSGSSTSLNPYVMYVSLTQSDYTDWSGIIKKEVNKLSSYNSKDDGTANAGEGYPMFRNPTPNAGYVSFAQARQFLYDTESTITDGVTLYDASGSPVSAADIKVGTTYYVDSSHTTVAVEGKDYTCGGAVYDFHPESRSSLNHCGIQTVDMDRYKQTPTYDIDYDVTGKRFTTRPTLGAYTSEDVTIEPEKTTDASGTPKVVNYYVDPLEDGGTEYATVGSSWDQPMRFFADAMEHIKAAGYPLTTTVNVYVKQGTVYNTNGFVYGRIRDVSINVPGNVNIYGGYPSANTGTSLDGRNPNTYMTIITADTQDDYDLNVPHLLKFENTENTVLDGFSIRYANARNTEMLNLTPVTTGAALTFSGAKNVKIRNCGIAGNTASQGAAADIDGESVVNFENCIFHNNESRDVDAGGTVKSVTGNIIVRSGSAATFCHCNFIRNVGNAIDAYGTVKVINSMFYANMRVPLEDTRKNGDKALAAVRLFDGGSFSGDHNLYDEASKTFITSNSLDDTNEAILDYTFSDTSTTYPRFVNPTKNAGVSTSGDVTYYGRAVSFQPHNNNPMVNRASTVGSDGQVTSDHTKWGTDMTGVITRDYGGLPDIGAVENHEGTVADEGEKAYPNGQRPYGGALYVRDYRKGSTIDTSIEDRDGSSWGNAINGNGTYTSTTVTGGTPTTPVASTIDNPKKYKISRVNERGYVKNNDGTYLNGIKDDYFSGDYFIFISGETDGQYYIYDVTQGKYVVYVNVSASANQVKLSNDISTNALWTLVRTSTSGYIYNICPGSNTNFSWNYFGGIEGGNLSLYNRPAGNDCRWYIEEPATTSKDVNGFQYAINLGNSQWQEDPTSLREVRVGAGTYNANLEWLAGVNVRGGYPAVGNPGEDERNISNSKDGYQTIIDGQSKDRVLLMPNAFSTQATFEGFTIQNGLLSGWDYGAGVYLRSGGILKNCLVQNNVFNANSSTGNKQGGGGIYMNDGSIVKNCKIMKNTVTNASSQEKYLGGAGVYAAGGTLINSLIVENITNSSYWLLGAGFYISKASNLYNCTIAYNYGNSGSTSCAATGGVWDDSSQSSFYNCIIWGNYATGKTEENMVQVGMPGYSSGSGVNKNLNTCYSSAWSSRWASDDYSDNNKVAIVGNTEGKPSDYAAFYNNCKSNEPFVRDEANNTDYSLKATATQCINKGSEYEALTDYDITVDINGEDRIQDCTIDKGAYEYNQSLDITPETFTTTVTTTGKTGTKAVFYVTPYGRGTASANSPTNAACASKLQKVLDAAGRYKYNHPADSVIVKVANSDDVAAGDGSTDFKYYACRTTDEADQSVRVWSIIVPRGVEVWGGYTDTYTDENTNGFYTRNTTTNVVTDNRDIVGCPTFFDSYYYNKNEKQNAYTYHVVTFTDRVFDGNGKAYKAGDKIGDPSGWTEGEDYMSMKEKTYDRAVIDGIYITGGNADAQVNSSSASTADINQYGGAAIVTDYAHVRNCIVRGNSATYGGALALTHNALVSGCLIDQNTADYGGGIYMFENGTQLSDGTVINTDRSSSTAPVDEAMAHVYTSTVVNNKANTIGGGIWFGQSDKDINIRVNSSVFWQNTAASQANVSGLYNPEKTVDNTLSTVEFYPFAYCAVQNLRISGSNNISLGNYNTAGARFASEQQTSEQVQLAKEDNTASGFAKYADFGHYALTSYSTLVRTGMPSNDYIVLVSTKGLAANDFYNMNRLVSTAGNRSYIEIGARAFDKQFANRQLMLRLFVASPEDVNADAAQTMINLGNGTVADDSNDAYYSQEGSSFAYPMQNLQDAIDYIVYQRTLNANKTGLNTTGANNLPFEICIAKGTYYPSRNLAGVYGHSPGNCFVFPEGVSVYGGFSVENPDKGNSFFGGYSKPKTDTDAYTSKLSENIEKREDKSEFKLDYYTVEQLPIDSMLAHRLTNDNNGNNIIEPWEFKNQTILSGDVENSEIQGTYNVVKIVADQNVVGMLPTVSETHATANETYKTQSYADYVKTHGAGSFDYEEGQRIVLDGLQITGGKAMSYIEGSTRYIGKYDYYCGGGLLVDGNVYCDDYNRYGNYYSYDSYTKYNAAKGSSLTEEQFKALGNSVYMHNSTFASVGYRDIPVAIAHCRFVGNEGGIGGALSSNGTVDIYESAFEHNRAVSGHEKVLNSEGTTVNMGFAGIGGAVMATHQFSAYNTLFANNEAYDEALICTPTEFPNGMISTESKNMSLGGAGGAVYMGQFGFFHLVNCDLVRNQANVYPAVFTHNPNRDFTDGRNGGVGPSKKERPSTVFYNQFINTLIWGNDINSDMSQKYDSNSLFKFNSRLICNYAKGEFDEYTNPDFTDGTNVPADQDALDKGSTEKTSDYGETAWFCAYEKNRGITPVNDYDLRDIDYTPFSYARDMIHKGGEGLTPAVDTYQNCNIQLSENNLDLEGPNFINPSSDPGYDGYNESADWSPARLTNLTDNGSGRIAQKIELVNDVYKATFETYGSTDNLPSRSVNKNSTTGYTTENVNDFDTDGAYTTTRVLYGYEHHRNNLPVGEMPYMKSAATGQELYRISYDPNPTHNQTYIDIGVYEYPHTALSYTTDGDEVDILWVSPIEKPDNGLPDGSDWSQPTSDLQRAIETLLASRNGHRKEIRLMDGKFTPTYTFFGKNLAFCIDTKSLNKSVTLPVKSKNADGSVEFDTGHGVVSLTIKGGYSRDHNNVCNPQDYPAIIQQQQRSYEGTDRWDYLFYISDGTQRYGYDPTNGGYDVNNGFGNYAPNEDGTTYDHTVNTIPIHFDGVTLVNNQASTGVNGAVIRYEDLPDTVTAPTKAHVSQNVYYIDADCTELSPEPTQYYKRKVAKYYTDATFTEESDVETAFVKYAYVETDANKIVISKTKVMNSGSYVDGDYTTSAVYIGKNGGSALLYNDVMHSNQGNPLVSAVKTTIINNTYALNNGRVDLNGENTRISSIDINMDSDGEGTGPMLAPRPASNGNVVEGSAIFNSVFWRNNDGSTQFILPGFVSAAKSGNIFSHNAVTGFSTTSIDYTSEDIIGSNYNVGLSDTNNDVINGPNFTNPNLEASTSTEIEGRDFTLQPSLRLLNKGSNSLYRDKLDSKTETYNIYDLAWKTSTRTDAAGKNRFQFDIDLGAYEYQNRLNRIIYVNPNQVVSGQGNSWSEPVAYGYLQAAIDLAAVYHVNNLEEEAYVFVKGAGSNADGLHLGETITMRNGVSVYGSILPTRTDDCPFTTTGTGTEQTRIYTQEDINNYIATLTAERNGLASPTANRTTISGIKVPTTVTFDNIHDGIVSLVDGFDITATSNLNPSGTVTEPVIDVQPSNADGQVAVRNLIVHDNDLSATPLTSLAQVNNALIYEALFRDNKVGEYSAHLKLGSGGYGVNLTVEGKTVGADNTSEYNGTDDLEKDHIFNSLVNYSGHDVTEKTLSGYNYRVADPNLNYQLTEQSKHIDQCKATNPIASVTTLAGFINYDTDRDLLGNPRLLKSVSSEDKIDRGAFETWRVDKSVVECESDGNYYPHHGSVVYIMKGNSLVLEPYETQTTDGVTTRTAGTSLTPAYLLLQDGASLYGGGNAVNVGYVGVERSVDAAGSMVSLPYAMNYLGTDAATAGVGSPSYATNGVLTLSPASASAYAYNGVGRSAWNSTFYDTNSPYWTSLSSSEATAANTGVLYQPAATNTYRFTAQGDVSDMSKYVYTETAGEIAKTVTLTQYDDRTSTGGAADFTKQEDMGWNCIGLPWLVSDYSTADTETLSGDSHYNMNIPHTLWLWYDGKTYPDGTTAANGDGGFYSVSSWDTSDWHLAEGSTAKIWVGEGFFTQTSAVADTEQLTFYRPVYDSSSPAKQTELDFSDGSYGSSKQGLDSNGGSSSSSKQDLDSNGGSSAPRYNTRSYVISRDTDNGLGDITIRVRGHVIYVLGLVGGETVTIYDASGRMFNMAIAQGNQYSTAVPMTGVYVVRVNEKTQKVMVK